jgi:biotin synthase
MISAVADSTACKQAVAPSEVTAAGEQVPNTELMTYKVVALARLACPRANIPSTTALATLNRAEGRELGLARGANVVMPNLTPMEYRAKYEIYPAKACIYETAEACHACMQRRIEGLGRKVGAGRGDARRSKNAECGVKGESGRPWPLEVDSVTQSPSHSVTGLRANRS